MTQQNACSNCPSARLCFCTGLEPAERNQFAKIVTSRVVVQRGHDLFESGDTVKSLYFVCSGSAKTWNSSIAGNEHILRFCLPGDIIGLGSINQMVYDHSATTLETTSICEFSLSDFEELATRTPSLNRLLIAAMSWEIAQLAQVRARTRAGSKLAYFLTSLAQNFAKHGYSGSDFTLTMRRREIAAHLGLTIETVSRTLTQFQKEGMLEVDGTRICIRDKKRLDECSSADFQPTGERSILQPVVH